MEDQNSDFNFEYPYHNHTLFQEHYVRKEDHGNLNFRLNFLEFSSTLQAKCSIDWFHKVEQIFYYKVIPNRVKVKLITKNLKDRASV